MQLLDKDEASDADCLFDVRRATFLIILSRITLWRSFFPPSFLSLFFDADSL